MLVVRAAGELGELHFEQIEAAGRRVLALFRDRAIKSVVLDLARADYFGSTAPGLFARLGRRVLARGGRMVLCNVSAHGREILHLAGLASMCPVHASLEEALKAVETRA